MKYTHPLYYIKDSLEQISENLQSDELKDMKEFNGMRLETLDNMILVTEKIIKELKEELK